MEINTFSVYSPEVFRGKASAVGKIAALRNRESLRLNSVRKARQSRSVIPVKLGSEPPPWGLLFLTRKTTLSCWRIGLHVDVKTSEALKLRNCLRTQILSAYICLGEAMLLKVMLIFSLIMAAACLAWIFPRESRSAEDEEWEDVPVKQRFEKPSERPKARLPR